MVQSQRKGGNTGEGGDGDDVDFFNGVDNDHVVIIAAWYRVSAKEGTQVRNPH